uniref:WRKY19-like zinc finger domain-containing protein n=1 Tax=Davidia involucrata TaxID=16924 RepID=A0A5B6ZAI1_DAVIN
MDSTPQNFAANFASNASKILNKVGDAGAAFSAVADVQLDSPGVSSSYFSKSKGSKSKWSATDRSMNLQDSSPLFLGLGHSSSSCTITSSGKEVESSSSTNLGLSINLHLGNERIPSPNNISSGTPKALDVERPKLDLELSLSTGPAESDITTVTQGFSPFQTNVEAPTVAGTVQLVDEGSTSSRWKLRPLVPVLHALQSIETSTPFDHGHNHINPTPVTPSPSTTTVDTPKSSVACASGVNNHQQRRNTIVKTCQFIGCIKGARGASGLCISHGGGQRCQKAGCQKGAEGRTVFCKAHGGGRRCQHLGCTKSAEGRTDYCIGHGGGRRCSHDDCTRAARGKSGLCIRHGGGKRCKMENCTRSAEGISGFCISHGGGRRCQYPACTKGAQGSTIYCKAHGGGKRCTYLGCTKGAEGSTPFCKGHGGGKRCSFEGGCTKSVHGGTLFCVNHGGGKRCAMPECTRSARGRTNFCVRHGGGKRCKFEGCGKSAQGSTDFCKAHGGGKRCSWGQLGAEFGGQAAAPCDKFARGKSGLCAAHSAQVQDKQIHGGGSLGLTLQDKQSITFEKMKGIVTTENNHASGIMTAGSGGTSVDLFGNGHQLIPMQVPPQDSFSVGNTCLVQFSLPEGRVHGGSLMAMLGGSTSFGASNNNQLVGGPSEPGKSYPLPHSWV